MSVNALGFLYFDHVVDVGAYLCMCIGEPRERGPLEYR